MSETAEHDARETLWVTDAEMIRRMGVPEKTARATIRALDSMRGSGFPQKHKQWGDRRYWPHVKAYFDRTSGATIPSSPRRNSYE